MIKFFRKIRQNLLMENKTGKYFKYAIGEIVLVVIGILIALSINNWNEKQKNDTKIKTLFNEVLKDLEQDIKAIDEIMFSIKQKDSITQLILDGEYKIDETKGFEHGELNSFFDMGDYFGQSNSGYNSLMDAINNVPEKYTSTLKNLKPLYSFKVKATYDNMESIVSLGDKIRENLMFSQPWYNDVFLNKPNKEAFAFIENPMYKNMVALYNHRVQIYSSRLFLLRLTSIVSYAEIQDAIFPELPKPWFLPTHAIKTNNEALDAYVGCYAYKTQKLTIKRKGNFLLFGDNVSSISLLVTDKNGDFVTKLQEGNNLNFTFVKDDANNVVSMIMSVNGQEFPENKKLKNCD